MYECLIIIPPSLSGEAYESCPCSEWGFLPFVKKRYHGENTNELLHPHSSDGISPHLITNISQVILSSQVQSRS